MLSLIKKLTIEEIYSNFNVFQKLSNAEFILSPYFQIPLYDILKDELCEFYGFFHNGDLLGICTLVLENDYYKFPTFEGINPYQDFIVDNRFRKEFITNILKDKKFLLEPILEDSPSIKILTEQLNALKESLSEVFYLELPKTLDEMIYKSKKHDEIVKILKKHSKIHNFSIVQNFDFYELILKTKMYLLPQKLQIFVSDLISICKTNGFLKLFTIDNEFYYIVFVYQQRAYLWHYYVEDETLKVYGFLKVLEHLILENIKVLFISAEKLNLNFPIKQKRTYRVYRL